MRLIPCGPPRTVGIGATGPTGAPGLPGSETCCLDVPRVENLTTDIDDSELLEHAYAFVDSLGGSQFFLDRESEQTADGITVAPTMSGVGRWLRVPTTIPAYLIYEAWFINPETGDNQNDGSTSGTALATAAELYRRIGVFGRLAPPNGLLVVTIERDLAEDDPIDLLYDNSAGQLDIRFVAVTTATPGGTLATVTAIDQATNVRWAITDPGGAFLSAIGKHLRLTSGTYAGYLLPVSKASSDTTAFVGETLLIDANEATSQGVPAPGDTYEIVDLVEATYGRIASSGYPWNKGVDPNSGFSVVSFRGFQFRTIVSSTTVGVNTFNESISFIECAFDPGLYLFAGGLLGTFLFNTIHNQSPIIVLSSLSTVMRGGTMIDSFINVQDGADFVVDYNAIFQGAAPGASCIEVAPGASAYVANAGFYDFTEGAIFLDVRAACQFKPYDIPGSTFFGSGAGPSVIIDVGGQATAPDPTGLTCENTTPGGPNFTLGGVSSVRPFDDAAGTYPAHIDTTWANLVAAIGSGGFDGHAISPTSGAAFVVPVAGS